MKAEEREYVAQKIDAWVEVTIPWLLKKLFPKISDKLVQLIVILIDALDDWRRTGNRP